MLQTQSDLFNEMRIRVRQTVCPLCHLTLVAGLDNVADAQTGDTFSILKCVQCGLGVTDPAPDEMDRYYANEYHGGRHGMTAKMCDSRRTQIVQQLCSRSSEKRILDVGCGDGTFLRKLAKSGWIAMGVEKYPGLDQFQGVQVLDSLDQAQSTGPYDCITLWHVLEHLPDVNETLASLQTLLKPDGVLVIAVPDFDSIPSKVFGASWLHLDVPRHLFHFTSRSLAGLMEKHGFTHQQLSRSEIEYDLMGIAQSVLNAAGAEPNAFMKRLTGRTTRTAGWRLWMQVVVGTLICVVGALPIWLAGRTRNGGTLIFAARVATPPQGTSN